jgi:phenylacetaldehyde dehydrogenase
MTAAERGRVIWRIGDLIADHVDELAGIESLDNGKPVGIARAADVPLAAELFQYMPRSDQGRPRARARNRDGSSRLG